MLNEQMAVVHTAAQMLQEICRKAACGLGGGSTGRQDRLQMRQPQVQPASGQFWQISWKSSLNTEKWRGMKLSVYIRSTRGTAARFLRDKGRSHDVCFGTEHRSTGIWNVLVCLRRGCHNQCGMAVVNNGKTAHTHNKATQRRQSHWRHD